MSSAAVLTWGCAPHGELGIGDFSSLPCDPDDETEGSPFHYQAVPMAVKGLQGVQIRKIVCRNRHSLALAVDGRVFAWGNACYGKLGIGDFSSLASDPGGNYQTEPVVVKGLQGMQIQQLACGGDHSCAVAADGRVFAWGCARYGQLGIGGFSSLPRDPDNEDHFSAEPMAVKGLQGLQIRKIACGNCHSLALAVDGRVFAWGSACYGQLGISDFSSLPSSPDDRYDHFSAEPVVVKGLQGMQIRKIACGNCHSLALAVDGRVFAWGSACYGKLGIGDFSSLPSDPDDETEHYQAEPVVVKGLQGVQIQQIACGHYHSLALAVDGRVFAWGLARYGKLGIGDFSSLPIDPDDEHAHYQAEPVAVKGLQGVQIQQIACSNYTSLALALDGRVFAWGSARYGKLGIGDFSSLPSDPADEHEHYQAEPVEMVLPKGMHCTHITFRTAICTEEMQGTEASSGLQGIFSGLVGSDYRSDVRFLVGDSTQGETVIPAHSLVLTSRSSYFKTMLDSSMQEGRPNAEIRVPDCSLYVFRCMLEWLYTDKLSLSDDSDAPDAAMELLLLADKYQLKELKEKLGDWMCSRLGTYSMHRPK